MTAASTAGKSGAFEQSKEALTFRQLLSKQFKPSVSGMLHSF